jgi:immune inhibitor A
LPTEFSARRAWVPSFRLTAAGGRGQIGPMRTALLTALTLILLLPFPPAHALENWKGKQRALVLLVRWAGQAAAHPKQEVERVFFRDGDASLRQYFLENSAGAYDLSGEVMDWRPSAKAWDPNEGCKPRWILEEGMKLFGEDIDVSRYDSDGDGRIDHLFVVHSGRIPHDRVGPSCVFGSHAKANEAVVFQSEGVGSIGSAIPIGFYIHEAGHELFGFPDLYEDHFHGRYGIGMWGMMGLGCWGVSNRIPRETLFSQPGHFEPLSKVEIGWISPQVVNRSRTRLRLRAVELSGDLIAIPAGVGRNYYLEYRSQEGFSQGHAGSGLLIWKNYELVQADGRDDLNNGNDLGHRPLPPIDENFGDASDPFPGSDAVTFFEDTGSRIHIRNIAHAGSEVEFDLEVPPSLAGLPYTRPSYAKFNGQERL